MINTEFKQFVQDHNNTLISRTKAEILNQSPETRNSFCLQLLEQKIVSHEILEKVYNTFCTYNIPYHNEMAYLSLRAHNYTYQHPAILTQKELKELSPQKFHDITLNTTKIILIEGSSFPLISSDSFENPQDLIPDLQIKIADKIFHVSSKILSKSSGYFESRTHFEHQPSIVDFTDFLTPDEFTEGAWAAYGKITATKQNYNALIKVASRLNMDCIDRILSEYKGHMPLIEEFENTVKIYNEAPFLKSTLIRLLDKLSYTVQDALEDSYGRTDFPLSRLKELFLLNLQVRRFSLQKWKQIKGVRIDSLYFCNYHHPADELAPIISTMHITDLDIPIENDTVLKSISKVKELKTLTLHVDYLSTNGCAILAKMTLITLRVFCYNIEDRKKAFENLTQSKTLQNLTMYDHLSNTTYTDILATRTL